MAKLKAAVSKRSGQVRHAIRRCQKTVHYLVADQASENNEAGAMPNSNTHKECCDPAEVNCVEAPNFISPITQLVDMCQYPSRTFCASRVHP